MPTLCRHSRNLWTSAHSADKNLPLLCIRKRDTNSWSLSHPPVSYPPSDAPADLGNAILVVSAGGCHCQGADQYARQRLHVPQWWGHLLAAFILVLPGSSFRRRTRGRRSEDCWSVRKLAQIGYSIYTAHVYILLPCFYECWEPLFYGHTQMETARHLASWSPLMKTPARSFLNLARLHSTPDNKLVAAAGKISILSWNFTLVGGCLEYAWLSLPCVVE